MALLALLPEGGSLEAILKWETPRGIECSPHAANFSSALTDILIHEEFSVRKCLPEVMSHNSKKNVITCIQLSSPSPKIDAL